MRASNQQKKREKTIQDIDKFSVIITRYCTALIYKLMYMRVNIYEIPNKTETGILWPLSRISSSFFT